MNNDLDFVDADEQECVDFIKKNLPKEYKNKISEEDIYFVLDLIDFYYESELKIVDEESDTMQEASINEEDMLSFIMKNIAKDKEVNLSEEEVSEILECEYNYGVSKGIYVEE